MAQSLFGSSVEERLERLPLHSRYVMGVFFDEAIKRDQAAHVLCFQNKPVSWTGPILKDKDKTFKDVLCLKGWREFKKNEYLFPHPHFIFNERVYEEGDFKVLDIFIVNKEALKSCLQEHLELFRTTLSPKFTIEAFISDLENGESLCSLLGDDMMLLGIVLGYGAESSYAFREANKNRTLAPPHTESYRPIKMQTPEGCTIEPVVFMGDPHSTEVHQLISNYEKELQDAWSLLRRVKNPLHLVLERLCQGDS